MAVDRRSTGERGEALAAQHYLRLGYHMLARNYRVRQGEVDIILQKDDLYVFCEVKTRASRTWDTPGAAVNVHKQRRIRLAAQAYLAQHRLSDPFMRFDVAEVWMDDGDKATIHVIEDAF